ncbi:hypothetical protein CHLRE_12g551502v5 [Chlamydomonas reinhardtii]|uniref:Uncharacterized protein n=1 Tax=Chlamydomonas reinhardtii TaxID=3055 RepID=A0A2K3D644_CHLRE|nr:uncharacterized protein CHLRE_12g551502v5 [Chlamydomonas reinhardtii]PNW76006.1 hypothetical protein CHLRE_12g551502v5 [Chlamydomonas reinhardtii]
MPSGKTWQYRGSTVSNLGRTGAAGIDEAPAAKRADTRAVGAAGSGLRASFLLPSAGRRPSPSVAGADGGAAGRARSSLASGGPFAGGGGEPGGGAGAAGLGPDPAVGVGECDYGTILSAADVTALLADRDEAPVTFEAVLQQALWDASDQCAVCCRGTGRALILRSLPGDVCAWEREWVADGGPPVCPRGLVPQLLEVAARADAELLQALWAEPF